MLVPYILPNKFYEYLLATERRNLGLDRYGIKSFVLSMMETAVNVSQTQVPAHVVHDTLRMGRNMLSYPINLFPGIAECLPQITEIYNLVLITKSDLFHQEQKLAQSSLEGFFKDVHILSKNKLPHITKFLVLT
tara:strand:+ start:116 stop:517 length:402 start_codon:yes stop_codon:yes gene_type:complete